MKKKNIIKADIEFIRKKYELYLLIISFIILFMGNLEIGLKEIQAEEKVGIKLDFDKQFESFITILKEFPRTTGLFVENIYTFVEKNESLFGIPEENITFRLPSNISGNESFSLPSIVNDTLIEKPLENESNMTNQSVEQNLVFKGQTISEFSFQSWGGNINQRIRNAEWKVAVSRGLENNLLFPYIETRQINSTLCVFSRRNINITLPPTIQIRDRNGNIILVATRQNYGNNVGYCANVTANLYDYIRFGSGSIIFTYQNYSVLEFQDDIFNTTISMEFYKNVTNWENIFLNYSILNVTNGFKFYVNDTYSNASEVNQYKIVWNSSDLAFNYDGANYFFSRRITVRDGLGFVREIETRRTFLNQDICSVIRFNRTRSLGGGNCTFTLSNNDKTLEVIFNRNAFLDPTVLITSASFTISTKTNVTEENNFTHLTIGNVSTGLINYTNLIFYMTFDSNTTASTTYDYSNNSQDASYQGNAYTNTSNGWLGGGLQLDGTGDYAQINDNDAIDFNPKNNFTWMAWVYPKTLPAGVFQKCDELGKGFSIFISSSGAINMDSCNVGVSFPLAGTGTVNTNTWTHIAVNYTNETVTFFNNGITNGSGTLDFADNTASNFFIGRGIDSGDFDPVKYLNGMIDEVMVVNQSLNQTQIDSIYKNQSSRFFSRGEQIFKSINVSGNGTENKINITINSTAYFSSSINVSVGNASGSDYVYYPEVAFTGNFVSNATIGNPNNLSLKFVFYAGNRTTNAFYSPTLENNVTIVSYRSGSTPSTNLTQPPNATIFLIDVFNITLNSTVLDADGGSVNVFIYGVNSTSTASFYKHGLIYQNFSVPVGINVTYNWTAPVIVSDNFTIMLFHLDNRSTHGENQTHAIDFSDNGNNGTAFGNAQPNVTGGKLAGGWQFDGDGDFINISSNARINFVNTGNYTWAAWVYPYTNFTNGAGILAKCNQVDTGVSIYILSTNNLTIDNCNAGRVSSSGTISTNNWTHIAINYTNGNFTLFINGQVNGSGSLSFASDTTSPFFIGRGFNSDPKVANYFNGTIDEVVVYNRSLNEREIKDLYRLRADKYFWKVNVTDSGDNNNESVTREFVIRDRNLQVLDNINCSMLRSHAINLYFGYGCTNANYNTCIGLNADLNLTKTGGLSLGSECAVLFNSSADSRYALFLEGTLNLSGANVTSNSSGEKFNLTVFNNAKFFNDSRGNISFVNIVRATNITDSRVNLFNVTIKNITILLNSSDITAYFIESGSLTRRFRLNASVYSGGTILQDANVTASNRTNATIFSLLTNAQGAVYSNLTEYVDTGAGKTYWNNYSINYSKEGYIKTNATSLNITSDISLILNLTVFDTIAVSGSDTLHTIFTRVNDKSVFSNFTNATRSCLYISTANINITSTGSLIIENCSLEMNNSATDGQYNLYVSGGTLSVNYSNISARTNSARYNFWAVVNSILIIKNSYVSHTGSGSANMLRGLAINTTNLTFENNTLSKGITADIEIHASNVSLIGSRLLGNDGSGTVTDYNVFCAFCNNVRILDSNISGSSLSDVVLDGNQTLYLINSNYSTHSVEDAGTLYKQWYVDIYVNDTIARNVSNANISFYNVTGVLTDEDLTNSSGDAPRQNITEYTVVRNVRTIWNNYTVNATKIGYTTETQSLNLTTNRKLTFATLNNPTGSIILNNPANNTLFGRGIFNVTLNATLQDSNNDIIDVFIYGVNSTSTGSFYKHGLLYQQFDVSAGTNVTYNWTAPVVIPENSTVLLFHLDNQSEFGENQTFVYDFSNFNYNNGTVIGDCRPNITGSKLGGGYECDGFKNGDYIQVTDHSSLDFAVNYTIAAWIYPYNTGLNGYIASKHLSLAAGKMGFFFRINYAGNSTEFFDGSALAESVSIVNSSANVFTRNNWTQVVVVMNASTVVFYANGDEVGTNVGSFSTNVNTNNLRVGAGFESAGGSAGFNGTIDEVVIWNRTLNSTDITNLYRLNSGKYFWKVNITDNGDNRNESETREFSINAPPAISNALINATSNLIINSTTTQMVKVNATITDDGTVNATLQVDSPDDVPYNVSITQRSGTEYFNSSVVLNQNGLWVFTFFANDTFKQNATPTVAKDLAGNNFISVNQTPNPPNLTSPIGSSNGTNRLQTFQWNVTDEDSDTLSFTIEVDDSANFDAPEINATADGITDCGANCYRFNATSQLAVDTTYRWRVRANDSLSTSQNSAVGVFQVNSLVTISLPRGNTTFGGLSIGNEDNTTDDTPLPLLLRNDGNVFLNVSLNASDTLWDTQALSTQYFQFRPDQAAGNGSYRGDLSPTAFTDIPPETGSNLVFALMNYTDGNDSAEVEIRIQVPLDEPPGNKSSLINFYGELTSKTL